MLCTFCRSENREFVRYCTHCGAQLPRVCPDCSASATWDDEYCGHCSKRLMPLEVVFANEGLLASKVTRPIAPDPPASLASEANAASHWLASTIKIGLITIVLVLLPAMVIGFYNGYMASNADVSP